MNVLPIRLAVAGLVVVSCVSRACAYSATYSDSAYTSYPAEREDAGDDMGEKRATAEGEEDGEEPLLTVYPLEENDDNRIVQYLIGFTALSPLCNMRGRNFTTNADRSISFCQCELGWTGRECDRPLTEAEYGPFTKCNYHADCDKGLRCTNWVYRPDAHEPHTRYVKRCTCAYRSADPHDVHPDCRIYVDEHTGQTDASDAGISYLNCKRSKCGEGLVCQPTGRYSELAEPEDIEDPTDYYVMPAAPGFCGCPDYGDPRNPLCSCADNCPRVDGFCYECDMHQGVPGQPRLCPANRLINLQAAFADISAGRAPRCSNKTISVTNTTTTP